MVSIASFQNCTPGPITELSGWQLMHIPCPNKWRKVNYGHKGKNGETGFVLHRKKINFILYLYFGNIIYGIIEKSYNFIICLQAVTIHI